MGPTGSGATRAYRLPGRKRKEKRLGRLDREGAGTCGRGEGQCWQASYKRRPAVVTEARWCRDTAVGAGAMLRQRTRGADGIGCRPYDPMPHSGAIHARQLARSCSGGQVRRGPYARAGRRLPSAGKRGCWVSRHSLQNVSGHRLHLGVLGRRHRQGDPDDADDAPGAHALYWPASRGERRVGGSRARP